MPTTVETLVLLAWVVVVSVVAIVMSGRAARWLQKSRGEEATAELHARYRLGIIFGAVGAVTVIAAAIPAILNLVPGGASLYIGTPFAFIALWAAQAKLARQSR